MSDVLKAARAKHAKLTAEAKALEAFIRLGEKLMSGQTPDAYLKPKTAPAKPAAQANAPLMNEVRGALKASETVLPKAAPSDPQKVTRAVEAGDALSRRLGALRGANVA